jgi:hypothetical protein
MCYFYYKFVIEFTRAIAKGGAVAPSALPRNVKKIILMVYENR